MHICILGAGIIGASSAHRLLQAGHEVTLLDAQEQAGAGASMGNGAQLSYSYVAPLADPSVWHQWPHYLFSPDSPLTLRPRADPAQWRWLIEFLAACTASQVHKTTVELLRLAYLSRQHMSTLRAELNLDFMHREAGKLVMLADAAAMASARKQIAFQAQFGSHQQLLDTDACVAIEPALQAASKSWAGGVYTASEEVGDCALFCRGLVKHMQAQRGFRFLSGTRATGLDIRQGTLHAVQAGAEQIRADAFVLALGADSAGFARTAGFRLPLYPLKGYSITVPLDAGTADAAPRVSITDLSRKIVYARLGNRLRVAGRVELVGRSPEIPRRAINELKGVVAHTFPKCGSLSDETTLSPWTGFRPATPTGLPIIGAAPVKNLYLNVGHGSLGWTLACGSASLLADQIGGRKTEISAHAFRLRN